MYASHVATFMSIIGDINHEISIDRMITRSDDNFLQNQLTGYRVFGTDSDTG